MRKLALYSAMGILFFMILNALLILSGPQPGMEEQSAWMVGISVVCYSVITGHPSTSRRAPTLVIAFAIACGVAIYLNWNKTFAVLLIATCSMALFDGRNVFRLAARRR